MDIIKSIQILKETLLATFSGDPPIDVNLLYLGNINKFDSIIDKLIDYLENCDLVEEKVRELESLACAMGMEVANYPENRLKEVVSHYFSNMKNVKCVKFLNKLEGIQIGIIAEADFESSQKIKYYIKTHLHGVTRNSYNILNGSVYLYEPLVYKILHLAGMSPEPLFMFADMKDFYIATKDAGYDDISLTQKEFITYDQVLKNCPELLESPIVRKGFIKADILSRVLSVTDVLTNPKNIGFVIENNQLIQFIIIDLCPRRDYANYRIFKYWMSGDAGVKIEDKHILSVLRHDDGVNKLIEAEECFIELQDMRQWIKDAEEYIIAATGNRPDSGGPDFIHISWDSLYGEFQNQISCIKNSSCEHSPNIYGLD